MTCLLLALFICSGIDQTAPTLAVADWTTAPVPLGDKCCRPAHVTGSNPPGCTTGCINLPIVCSGESEEVAVPGDCETKENATCTASGTVTLTTIKYRCTYVFTGCPAGQAKCVWAIGSRTDHTVAQCSGTLCEEH